MIFFTILFQLSISIEALTATFKSISKCGSNGLVLSGSRDRIQLSSATPRDLPLTSKQTALHAVKEATFGMGCFWEPAECLRKQPGVIATTVGYTGCSSPNKPPPTYDTVCFGNDYVEAVQIVYDDTIVSYETLLDYFFELQKPGYKRQYASVIFIDEDGEDAEEKAKLAAEWKENRARFKGKRSDNLPYEIVQIESLTAFYRAEEYHQRYWEKQKLRGLVVLLLIAGASGAYDGLFDSILTNVSLFDLSFDALCNAAFISGAGWMLLERLLASDVRELKRGELTASALSERLR